MSILEVTFTFVDRRSLFDIACIWNVQLRVLSCELRVNALAPSEIRMSNKEYQMSILEVTFTFVDRRSLFDIVCT
jgi:hypothetical protein